MFGKPKSSETERVEAMILENNARTIRRDGMLDKQGPILWDPMLNEAYAVTEKPMLAYRKKGSTPVYLIDRDSGVTVTMEKVPGSGTQSITLEPGTETPEDTTTPHKTFRNVMNEIMHPEPEKEVIHNPKEIIIDGRRFSGWCVRLERSEQLVRLNTDPSLVGRSIVSKIIGESFAPPISKREKLMFLLVGGIAGIMVGLMF